MELKKVSDEKLKHYLNEALNNVLEAEGIKIKQEAELDLSLDLDYCDLLNKFKNHLKMVIKINKKLRK